MTGVPPFVSPGDQESPICVADVTPALFKRLVGADGFVKMIAPLPFAD